MEDESNNKRLLIAAGLCFLVMVLWNTFFPPPLKKHTASTQGSQAVATSTATAGAGTGTSTGSAAAIAVTPTSNVPPETYTFRGNVHSTDTDETIPYELTLTNVGGGIDSFILPSYKERDGDNRKTNDPIALANPSEKGPSLYGQMAGIELVDDSTFHLPPKPTYKVEKDGDRKVVYRYVTAEGVEIEREYSLDPESFKLELAVTIKNGSPKPQSYRLQMSSALEINDAMRSGGGFLSRFVPPPDHLKTLCHTNGKVERHAYQELENKPVKTFAEAVRWAAIDRQYFISAIVPRDGTEPECRVGVQGTIARASLVSVPKKSDAPKAGADPAKPNHEVLEPGGSQRHMYAVYLGVKKPSMLTLVNADLEEAIDYTILGMNLAFLCAALLWILKLFHGWTHSWGVAILGLTVLVKAMLFPLNQRSGRSMRAMSALKPQLDAIREKYPDDRQRQSEEMLKLYKEHNVNPAGGCLPVLMQMPIWFALYRSLWVSVDLFQQSFLWIPDLTARDPMWVLPVLLVVVMFLQQKMTPSTMDPAQQKIMTYTMPLLFGGMMMALPAGLCFYILVNTLLTIAQQHFINRSIGPIGGSATVQGATA